MMNPGSPIRRGLTIIELLLSLMVTAMVAGAIAGMMGAVSNGLSVHQDTRSVMIRSNAAQTRLAAYITPSRCILSAGATSVAIWLDDSRESLTVHASEVRWLVYESVTRSLKLAYVKFPDAWSQTTRDLEDAEYAKTSDWSAVLGTYEAKGLIEKIVLVDALEQVSVSVQGQAQDAKQVGFDLTFHTENDPSLVYVSASIDNHQPPLK